MAVSARFSTRAVVALDAIERVASDDLSPEEVIEQIVHRIAGAIDVDAFFAGATDPDTGLSLGAGLSCNLPDEVCTPAWEHELLIPDYNKFADLTAADPVGDLRLATGGKLSRSARHRTLNGIADLEDELRATLYAGGRSWGILQLSRFTGGRPFTAADREFLRVAAPLAGVALRRALLEEPAHTDPTRGPGVIVVDQAGTVVSATAEAGAWLDELNATRWTDSNTADIPLELLLLLLGVSAEPGAPSTRTRLRTPGGTWLTAHAAPLIGSGHRVIVIEPAKASETASIVVEAYGLTHREVEVARLVARGLSTAEIAATLFLSQHTIRDHLKAIFEKTGVSSRSELTSKLFAEHYHLPLNEALYAPADRVRQGLELASERT